MKVPSQTLRQTAAVEAAGANHGDGPTWGTPTTVRCRMDWGTKLYRDTRGEQVTVEGVMTVRPDAVVKAGDRVTVDGHRRTAFTVDPITDPGGRTAGFTVAIR